MAVLSRAGSDGLPYPGAAAYLIEIATGDEDELSKTALASMFGLHADPRIPLVAGSLSSELFAWPAPDYSEEGERSFKKIIAHRKAARGRALALLSSNAGPSFANPPPAWVKEKGRGRGKRRQNDQDESWNHPDHDFQPKWAADLLPYFPVEIWMAAPESREALLRYADELVKWTTERAFPAWDKEKNRRDGNYEMTAWYSALAKFIARIAGFVPAEEVIARFLNPFSGQKEGAAMSFLGAFTWNYVCKHIYDARELREDVIPMGEFLLDRALRDSDFEVTRYRAGKIHTHGVKDMINSLMLVLPESAPAATRFANGDYSEVGPFLPLVGKFMDAAGWHPYVIRDYLTLCERAGNRIPIKSFSSAITSALDKVAVKQHLWRETTILARIAGAVQRLAEGNHPLKLVDAQALLLILDRLVDLGDRRAAALQQSEYFRNVRVVKAGG